MTLEEAVLFCEEHECNECPVYGNDKRTEAEWYEVPCCENLVTERSRVDAHNTENIHIVLNV